MVITMEKVFRQLKAKKALFGFEASVHASLFIQIGTAVTAARKVDPDLLFEVTSSFGGCVAKVYTNDSTAAKILESATYDVIR